MLDVGCTGGVVGGVCGGEIVMDRLIWKAIDWDHKPITSKDRETARAGRKKSQPRAADTYRGARRNSLTHEDRSTTVIRHTGEQTKSGTLVFDDGSLDYTFQGTIGLNRSKHWKPADNYFDARDLSQSNRPVV